MRRLDRRLRTPTCWLSHHQWGSGSLLAPSGLRPPGGVFLNGPMNRTSFLVDGFKPLPLAERGIPLCGLMAVIQV
jgi:hypothetical protein